MNKKMPSRRERFVFVRQLHSTEYLPHRLEKRVEESANTQTKELPQALKLDDIGPQTRHDTPDVVKTEASEVDSTHDGCRYAADGGDDPVTPVFGSYKSTEADSPHTIDTVRAVRLSEHILKEHLYGVIKTLNDLSMYFDSVHFF